MILYACTTEVERRVDRVRYGHPPRQKSGRGCRKADQVNKSTLACVKIHERAEVQRGHCPRLEHHHLNIRTHPTYRWPGKQHQQQCCYGTSHEFFECVE